MRRCVWYELPARVVLVFNGGTDGGGRFRSLVMVVIGKTSRTRHKSVAELYSQKWLLKSNSRNGGFPLRWYLNHENTEAVKSIADEASFDIWEIKFLSEREWG